MIGHTIARDLPPGPLRRPGLLLLLAVLGLVLGFPLPGLARERAPYRIGYMPKAAVAQESKDRLEVVYARAGLPVEFIPLPHKRSLTLSAEGLMDGEVGRIGGLEDLYPSMVRVDVKLLDFCGVAYVLKGRDIGEYRESLLDVMKVGGLRGVVWVDTLMKDRSLDRVTAYENLFGMLLEGRIDIALSSRRGAEETFRKHPHCYENVQPLEPLVFQTTLYHYLNKKNADIVPLLEKALRELRAEDYWGDNETR